MRWTQRTVHPGEALAFQWRDVLLNLPTEPVWFLARAVACISGWLVWDIHERRPSALTPGFYDRRSACTILEGPEAGQNLRGTLFQARLRNLQERGEEQKEDGIFRKGPIARCPFDISCTRGGIGKVPIQ